MIRYEKWQNGKCNTVLQLLLKTSPNVVNVVIVWDFTIIILDCISKMSKETNKKFVYLEMCRDIKIKVYKIVRL